MISIMLALALGFIGLGALILCVRLCMAKDSFNKMLLANAMGGFAIVFIVVMGLYVDTDFYIDVALTIAILGLVSNIAFLRYIEHRVSLTEE